jgi:hypothetical protein
MYAARITGTTQVRKPAEREGLQKVLLEKIG